VEGVCRKKKVFEEELSPSEEELIRDARGDTVPVFRFSVGDS
jgi:hypothetical protein